MLETRGAPGADAQLGAGRPGTTRSGALPSLFGLAPCGVYPAAGITAGAVRSYRTFSPLPRRGLAVQANLSGLPGDRPPAAKGAEGVAGRYVSVALAVHGP